MTTDNALAMLCQQNYYLSQTLAKVNIFLSKHNLFREIAKNAIVLNYDVINDVMIIKYINQ